MPVDHARGKTPTDYAKQAGCHHAALNTFAAVVALLEGGTVPGGTGADKSRDQIIRLCKAEQQRQLKKYDAALAHLTRGVGLADSKTQALSHADGPSAPQNAK
jgi:hypothetical protein